MARRRWTLRTALRRCCAVRLSRTFRSVRYVIPLLLLQLTATCVHRLERRTGPSLATVDQRAPYLKVHMQDGGVYILTSWKVDDAGHALVGKGEHRGLDRELVATGDQ